MASALAPSFKQLCLGGDIDLLVDTIKIVAVDTDDYTFSSAHDNLDDVLAAARIGTTGALTGKTIASGVFDSDTGVIPSATGDTFEAIWIYKEGATEADSPLIAFLDGFTPLTPNGNNINVSPNASGWFAL